MKQITKKITSVKSIKKDRKKECKKG